MSGYAAREAARDAILVGCVVLLVWVGLQLTSIQRIVAVQFEDRHETIATTLYMADRSANTVVRTPRSPGESYLEQQNRHRALLRLVLSMYPEVKIDANTYYDVDERR